MDLKPFDVWKSIYSDELETGLEEEKSELRKISMIYCAFQIEIDKLKANLSEEIIGIRNKLKRRSMLQKCENFSGLAESVPFDAICTVNKENEDPVPLQPVNLNELESDDLIESSNSSTFFEKCHTPSTIEQKITDTSPIMKRSSFAKRKNSPPTILHPIITDKETKTSKLIETKSDQVKTPTNFNDPSILECSIIEDTPEAPKRTKPALIKSKNYKKTKLTQSRQKNTLTQMFTSPQPKKKREIDSNDPSMDISKIIDLINESSGSETDAELDETKDNLDINEHPMQGSTSRDNKILQEKRKRPEVVYAEPVVRGKERKKLKGWSCKECEQYYEGLNLPPEELQKKKDQCSRHRYKFKPRQETYTGFWDLTFGPTPKTQESEVSTVYKYRKK